MTQSDSESSTYRWWARAKPPVVELHQPSAAPRLAWDEICRRPDCGGRWVALHECVYDDATGHALEGNLVDSDDDLAVLCLRVRDSAWKNCAILFCSAPTAA